MRPNRTKQIGLRLPYSLGVCLVFSLGFDSIVGQQVLPLIVINEVHHDATPKTERAEFVELYNAGEAIVDLSGWQLDGVGNYTFPASTQLAPDQFLVVAEDILTMRSKFRIRTPHQYSGGLENDGELLRLIDEEGTIVDRVDYQSGFPWPTGARGAGSSMELIHPLLENDLGASWRSSVRPTPLAANSVFSINAPPATRQIRHTPQQPRSGETVLITVKVTDLDGVSFVKMSYQLVDPGGYIRKTDTAYETSWIETPMLDDGTNGDELAGDDIYTVAMQATVQTHRRLVRYRIAVKDTPGNAVQIPYADDENPNFAYFVYDGVPAWTGTKRPRVTPQQDFPSEVMASSQPVYHLIANVNDVSKSQYDRSSDGVRMWGTLIYDNRVYDHIQYYNRGEASTYVSGKNKWRFKFNRGRDFKPRDNYLTRYEEDRKTLNLNACASPWLASNRGIAGLDEAVPHRLFQLAGVLGSSTHWVQLRVIDAEDEAPPNQYSGDLWGLYLAIEHPDDRFLAERDLPDRSIYKIERNSGDKKNQGPDQSLNSSDWNAFWRTSENLNSVNWWRTNLDLQSYYSFRAINRATGNVDLRDGANYFMSQNVEGRWAPTPWDLDMMFAPVKHIWSGVIRAERCLDHPEIRIGFRNRCREILDLLFTDIDRSGGQAAQLVQELSVIVNPPNLPLSMVDVDEFMWSYNSRTSSSHQGPWYSLSMNETRLANNYRRTIPTPDHEGFQQSIINYMYDTRANGRFRVDDAIEDGYGFGYLSKEAADSRIPDRPMISYHGKVGFPVADLKFKSSPFANQTGAAAFASMEWRIGEIANPNRSGHIAGNPWVYEIEEVWNSGQISPFTQEIDLPATVLRPDHTYRARVRHFNASGRASHWSEAIEFVPSEPDLKPYRDSLLISEIMYHPAGNERAEFIELSNMGQEPLDLTGVRFTKGIDFNFPTGVIIAPGENLLIIGDRDAFEAIYGETLPVIGVWERGDRLSNSGEKLKLSFGAGISIHEFDYATVAPWPSSPTGNGRSLVLTVPEGGVDHSEPANWKNSDTVGGNPGTLEGLSLIDWLASNGLSPDEELSDLDSDGLSTLYEYGVGRDPQVAEPVPAMELVVDGNHVNLSFRSDRQAISVHVFVEFSNDLTAWQPTEIVSIARGTIDTVVVRQPSIETERTGGFYRLQLKRR